YDWLRRSGWDATVPQRQIALKQRIDFALACLAVIVLFHRSALLSLVPWQYRGEFSLEALAALTVFGLSVAMIVAAQLAIGAVYWRERGGFWVSWAERRQQYRRVIRESEPLCGLPGRWYCRAGLWLVAAAAVLFVVSVVLTAYALTSTLYAAFFSPSRAEPGELIHFERLAFASNGLS